MAQSKAGAARRRKHVPAYRGIYQRLRAEILSGRLAAQARLPSSRMLARQLGVARGTVELAYRMLAGEGYTVSDGARGTVVNPALPRAATRVPLATPAAQRAATHSRRLPPKPLLFQMGLPSLDAFPRKPWAQLAARTVRQLDAEQLTHPHDALGYAPLREAIASYLRIARDIACRPDQVLITAGFQGALALIAQALLRPDDAVWVEDPGYFFARELLAQLPLRLAGVPVDAEGIDIEAGIAAAPTAALALVTPTHQFPFGTTLPIDRRLKLLDWADRQKAWIVEDDYDCEFHHRGLPPPALKSLDRTGRVIYVGSFSKVLFPGLRLGYLLLPDAIAERLALLAQAAHPAPALLLQQIVERFMAEGLFARHLSRMRTLYTERRKALAEALAATLPNALEITLSDGGMHFVARLKGGLRDTELVTRLRRHGVGPSPLSRCALGAAHNGLMIGYTNTPREQAGAAAERMLAAMRG